MDRLPHAQPLDADVGLTFYSFLLPGRTLLARLAQAALSGIIPDSPSLLAATMFSFLGGFQHHLFGGPPQRVSFFFFFSSGWVSFFPIGHL